LRLVVHADQYDRREPGFGFVAAVSTVRLRRRQRMRASPRR
jgi:hypothetical protein